MCLPAPCYYQGVEGVRARACALHPGGCEQRMSACSLERGWGHAQHLVADLDHVTTKHVTHLVLLRQGEGGMKVPPEIYFILFYCYKTFLYIYF